MDRAAYYIFLSRSSHFLSDSSLTFPKESTMLAFSPPLFSTLEWPLDDPISHAQNYIYGETETSDSFLHSPSSQPQVELNCPTPSAAVSGNHTMAKKLNHNASERYRRKKINSLYSSLRSLLPAADQAKKLSIPSTVSRVLKYIPELQHQVERLIQKKEELLSKISRQGDLIGHENQRNGRVGSSLSAVSARRLSEREIVVQISTFKVHESQLSEVLLNLEEDGLLVINASSFESFGGWVFYNLHLQVEGIQIMACELLSEKLLSLCGRREAFPLNVGHQSFCNGGSPCTEN